MQRAKRWRAFLLLTSLVSLTACEGAISRTLCPTLQHYSAPFQDKAAAELESDARPPCHPLDASAECSALQTLVLDYKTLRDQCRALDSAS